MVKIIAALLAVANADTLNLTWEDCGDASTHAKVNDVSPKTINSGATNKVVGTGDLDEDVAGASFDATIKASGVTVSSCNGDASKDVVCKLPLGVGSITLKAVSFPLKAGSVPINTEVELSSLIPASLAKTDVHIEGTADTGDKLVCLDLHTAKAAVEATVGSTLSLTFEDCGDASTHAKVNDVSPKTISSGTTNKVVGTGNLDEDVAGATFDATIKASGVTVSSCNGDASKDVVCKLPLGVGSITLKAVSFPLKAGSVPINTEVELSSLIPASLAKTDVHIEGTADTGDKLVCLDLHTAQQSTLASVDCSKSACPSQCECTLDKCADSVNTCLADAQCAQGQSCALTCACGDTACNLKCAAATPSPKALPVATCINSNCAGTSVEV